MMWVKLNKTEFKTGMIVATGNSFLWMTKRGILWRSFDHEDKHYREFRPQTAGMHEHWLNPIVEGLDDGGMLVADEVFNVSAANAIVDYLVCENPNELVCVNAANSTITNAKAIAKMQKDVEFLRMHMKNNGDKMRFDFFNVLPELSDKTFPVGSVVLAGRLLALWRKDKNTMMKFCFASRGFRPVDCKKPIEDHMNNGKPAIKLGVADTASQFAEVATDFYMNLTAKVADDILARLGETKETVCQKVIIQTQPKLELVKFSNVLEKAEQQPVELDDEKMKGGDVAMIDGVLIYRHPLTMKVGAVVYDYETNFDTHADLVSGFSHNYLIEEKIDAYGMLRGSSEKIANMLAAQAMKEISERNDVTKHKRFDRYVKTFSE